jgi:hypothetical protein
MRVQQNAAASYFWNTQEEHFWALGYIAQADQNRQQAIRMFARARYCQRRYFRSLGIY